MATIDASTGQIMDTGGINTPSDLSAHTNFVGQLTNMLADAQNIGKQGVAGLQAQKSGLEVGQAGLGMISPNNPLSFLFNMAPNSAVAGDQNSASTMFNPGIASIQGQQEVAQQGLTGFTESVKAEQANVQTKIEAYNALKPKWELSPTPNENGEFYFYNSNTPPGQQTQVYAAGKIPPGAGGSPGGSPGSADSTATLSASHNPYGIKMTSTTTDLFKELDATPGPKATDGGNFWSFPDDTTGEKAARALLTSSLYSSDSVDQALRQWSNYTGTGQYPGYNGDILKGTGIDPNATIKSLSTVQVDTVLAAMKKAENVGGVNNGTKPSATSAPIDNSVIGKIAHNVAWGIGGMSYDDGVSQVTNAFGNAGGNMVPKLMPSILAENPNFNKNQSNAITTGQGANTEIAAKTGALIDKTNQVMAMLPDKFARLSYLQQQGGDIAGNAGDAVANSTGMGKTESDDYYRTLADARASANQALTTAASLGVVTGGKTADSLFPQHMSKEGLATAIATVKDLEEKTNAALAKLSNAGSGSVIKTPTNNNPLGI